MFRMRIMILLCCAFVLAGNNYVFAVDLPWEKDKTTNPSATTPPSKELLSEKVFRKGAAYGEVIAVDASANTITVNMKGDATTFTVDDATRFSSPYANIADVKTGDYVLLKYVEDGKNTATSISVKRRRKEL